MKQNALGQSGLSVSEIVLGTMTFGERNSEAEAQAILDAALAGGITTLDVAEMYPSPPDEKTHGGTEAILGRWMKERGNRAEIILATKITGRSNKTYLRPWGGDTRLDRRNIQAALDASLTRLQTDYIDLYQLHWPDRKTNIFGRMEYRHDPKDEPVPLEETLAALQDQIKAGKIRAIGISNETPWGMMRCVELARHHGLPLVASIQNAYSLVNRTYEMAHAEIGQREGISLLAYSPLGMGLLTGKYRHGARPADGRLVQKDYYARYSVPEGMRAADAYADLADQHGLAPVQMALAFLLQQPFLAGAIVGATSVTQLQQSLGALAVTLDKEVLKGIEAVHRRFPNPCP